MAGIAQHTAAGAPYLAELCVENLAVAERVRVAFAPGFTVLTGETGVGKSILVDALKLLTGGRADVGLIRAGAARAVVEGVFRRVPEAMLAQLAEAGVLAEGDELVVRRVISRDGNNACYVNDRRVGTGLLSAAAEALVDILGQHAQRSLTAENTHGGLLDAAGGLLDQARDYRNKYNKIKALIAEIEQVEAGRQEALARAAFLSFGIDEIGAADLSADEEEQLAEELSRLSHAESLRSLSDQAFTELYGAEGAVLSRLSGVMAHLAEIGRISATGKELGRLVDDARVLLEETADGLRRFRDAARPDAARQDQVEERLALIESLKRKYGKSVAEILATGVAYRAELTAGGDVEDQLAGLYATRDTGLTELAALADDLVCARAAASESLATRVQRELARLAMPHARLSVETGPYRDGFIHGDTVLGPDGREQVRFLLAANPGEGAKPLAKVASGGELSRILLAVKMALIDANPVPCLVFDEVDAGIGGGVAEQVGRMLAALGTRYQVFCVTHLPQVASCAETHVRVEKETDGSRTRTRVTKLADAERVAEVARMLGGQEVTDTTVAHAKEMLG